MSIDCGSARELISARLDGELSRNDVGVLDSHLSGCAECRAFAHEAERLQARLRLAPAPSVPDLSEQILASASSRLDRPKRRPALAAAAAVLVVLGAGVLAFGSVSNDEPPPDLAVADVFLGESDQLGAVYVTMVNRGGDDRLVGASSAHAAQVTLHRTEELAGVLVMQPVSSVAVDANSTVVLAPLGGHLMLEDLSQPLSPGETITLVLTFARSGDVVVEADVLPWAEVAARSTAVGGA